MSNSKHRLPTPVFHLAFWGGVLAALEVSSNLAETGLFFSGVPPVPLRANPLLLALSVVSLVAVLLVS